MTKFRPRYSTIPQVIANPHRAMHGRAAIYGAFEEFACMNVLECKLFGNAASAKHVDDAVFC
jgi:hypothetical protein